MKKISYFFILLSLFTSCTQIPIIKGTQLRIVPETRNIRDASFKSYYEEIRKNKLLKDKMLTAKINEVSQNIIKAAEVWYQKNNKLEKWSKFEWEVHIVDAPIVNATCRPGGKIIIYTGILDIAQNEHGLATIIGHEVSHALAEHVVAQVNRQVMKTIALVGLATASIYSGQSQQQTETALKDWNNAFTLFGQLPYSRRCETESDKMGLFLMCAAGYDPTEAPKVWQRMMKVTSHVPQFLSTHPSTSKRAENLAKWISEARAYAAQYPVLRPTAQVQSSSK